MKTSQRLLCFASKKSGGLCNHLIVVNASLALQNNFEYLFEGLKSWIVVSIIKFGNSVFQKTTTTQADGLEFRQKFAMRLQ